MNTWSSKDSGTSSICSIVDLRQSGVLYLFESRWLGLAAVRCYDSLYDGLYDGLEHPLAADNLAAKDYLGGFLSDDLAENLGNIVGWTLACNFLSFFFF
jgi:hypothetical protein